MLDKFLSALGESLGLKKPNPARKAGEALYASAVSQSRQVVFYTDYGVKDEIGARFELLVLHVVLLISRLKSENEQHRETSQALFDSLLLALDDTLREQGVGDLTVPKKMKKLSQQVYTRLVRWDEIWEEAVPETRNAAQADYLLRTVYAADEEPDAQAPLWAAALSDYIHEVRTRVGADGLLAGEVVWPEVKPLVKRLDVQEN
ncbi:ubiquinol-cytochrome C chaperone family protein [Asticcacaulis sp. AND118]|uniref:ubiquinol-cytochrome C chaperone family protein n=1 Tax=Asticcacaulis sp. AND118 TaxID=2840468 RepID=UPI001CFF5535|nr:ubiquinol-cytochrome C chaperone family protein [Asticcacaulis sp. AND118]UDF02409.1 ubiquinol-cytochrome C chaperone [Asticcacaulis sp. AND118]